MTEIGVVLLMDSFQLRDEAGLRNGGQRALEEATSSKALWSIENMNCQG